ncbi:MAG TPA: DoxX family protein [Zoogloea sp.]|uniref:DoxX family protein n=1 Tax=Zoogloea sp. TaxID=49181 RepID=UPI002CA180D0|nr:DoxX family protein [Zoogloea sp.]HMV17035.1 DoxX family protein [Rhodocyclaceae bacterium]HMY49193.1 DoxX family protein [Rhodocyclaceae bacterium]HNC78553.1 DoxX family protein [Rhodocyclaceae bacterium]HND23755.1 DoxX family protein [Rhodocyclaceae bacterium]HNH15983.1 DoxX family protein [Zoogloea sp.]
MNLLLTARDVYRVVVAQLQRLSPLFDLAIRLYVARVFILSGLVKLQSWDSTLALFENEYEVPLLPPEIAAYMGTGAELILPVFLALGLGGRFFAFALFVFNAVAVLSYPDLTPAGLKDHILWGSLLLVTLFHGPGPLAADRLLGTESPVGPAPAPVTE